MTALIDTSILVDHLRGLSAAADILEQERATAVLHASEMTRLEVLAGMRQDEEDRTHSLLSSLVWHPVDEAVAEERAGWAESGCRATTASTALTSP